MHPAPATCPNCGSSHPGTYCSACGQYNRDLHVPIGALAREVVEESLGIDSRLRHTAGPLLARPGAVTRDYLAGRRVRYTSPLKLYLIASVVFFVAFAHRPRQDIVHVGGEISDSDFERSRFIRLLESKHKRLATMEPAEASRALTAEMAETVPKAMIALLPIFALLLKWLYRRRFYAEHLVFALHFHALAFLVYTPAMLVPGGVEPAVKALAWAFILWYLFVALRTVYGEPRARTFAKMAALVFTYGLALSIGIAGAAFVSILML